MCWGWMDVFEHKPGEEVVARRLTDTGHLGVHLQHLRITGRPKDITSGTRRLGTPDIDRLICAVRCGSYPPSRHVHRRELIRPRPPHLRDLTDACSYKQTMTRLSTLISPPLLASSSRLLGSKLVLHLLDSQSRVETLGAGLGALQTSAHIPLPQIRETHIEDSVASVERHGVLHLLLSLRTVRVLIHQHHSSIKQVKTYPRVGHPSVRLHQDRGTEVGVLVPPVLELSASPLTVRN
jgi:hypothetical protein